MNDARARTPQRPPSILFIEDDPIDQMMYQRLVGRCKLFGEVTFSSYADEAFQAIIRPNAAIPEIIVVDLNIPRMSGVEFIEAIEKHFEGRLHELFVVVATTSSSLKDQEDIEHFQCVQQFLNKPLDMDHFESLVHSFHDFAARHDAS